MRKTLLLAVVALFVAGPASAVTPVKIADTRAAEFGPSVSDDWQVWTANTLAHPRVFRAYVRATGGSTTTMPTKGYDVRAGNIIGDGPHAGQVVVQLTPDIGAAFIRFYDLTTGLLSDAPAAVNGRGAEFSPSVSGDYLAYIQGAKAQNLVLYRFSTDSLVKLASGAFSPQINGDYLAYSTCTGTTSASCKNVYRYRISTTNTVKMPAPTTGRANYYAAVDADGVMYWVEGSATRCGKNVKIRTWGGGGVSTVWTAPDGAEVASLEADVLTGTTALAYSKYVCRAQQWGAYMLTP